MSKLASTILTGVLFGALAAPALAQDGNPMASTQYPPPPGTSSEAGVQSLNSLPRSAATAVRGRPGSDVETTRTGSENVAPNRADEPAG